MIPSIFQFSSKELTHTPDGIAYYHLPEAAKSDPPFLHAFQDGANDGKCGYYALNSYLGFSLPFHSFIDALVEYMVKNRGFSSREEVLLCLNPSASEELDINLTDIADVDIEMIQGILQIIAPEHQEISPHFVNTTLIAFDLKEKNWDEISDSLAPKLDLIDRFILGIASPVENHLTCWRKDSNNFWWKIDSLLQNQTGFENNFRTIDEIRNSYGSYSQGTLLLLIPNLSLAID